MKTILCILIFVTVSGGSVWAQSDSWKILLENKIIAQYETAKASDTLVVYLTKAQLSKGDFLQIDYEEVHQPKNWNRTFSLFYNNSELMHFDFTNSSGTFDLPMKKLAPELHDKKNLILYTYSLPNDKALAATVRVKRITICKFAFKN